MKISDLLGEGWESDERADATAEPPATGSTPGAPAAPPPVPAPPEPVEPRSSDVIPSLASWVPTPEPRDPEPRDSAHPVSARAQLADLAAGLAMPTPPAAEVEAIEEPNELEGLDGLGVVVDDLLPGSTKRSKGSSRGSSRSGSRRRGR